MKSEVNVNAHYGTEGGNVPILALNAGLKQGYSICEDGDGVRLQYPKSKTARGRVIKQASNTVQTGGTAGVFKSGSLRRLTPRECERLQGFPDDWTACLSDSRRYKCLGNAVTVNVVQAVGEKLLLVEEAKK